MAKKLRRSYLNDYQPGMNGEYYYTGRYMGLEGTLAQRSDLNKKMLILSIIAAAVFICSGILDGGTLWNTFYVLIPFAAEAVCLGIMIYKIVRFTRQQEPLKEYIYKQTVPVIKGLNTAAAVCAAVELIACIVYMIINKEIVIAACVVFLAAKAINIALMIVLKLYLKKFKWTVR